MPEVIGTGEPDVGRRGDHLHAGPAFAPDPRSTVPSVEALSMTVIVVGNGLVWPTSESRHGPISVAEL